MALKYKAGDQVRIKSLDWYNMHCDDAGNVDCGCEIFEKDMKPYLGKVFTIHRIVDNSKYEMEEAFDFFLFTDEMIEGLVEELLDNDMEEHQKIVDEIMAIQGIEPIEAEMEEVWHCPDGYIFKDENGNVINATKIVLEKKKKEYPKTLEECCEVLDTGGYQIDYFVKPGEVYEYEKALITKISALYNLIICRDAYWKIAGEEMELGKPWEPDWNNEKQDKYGFHNEVKYTIINSAIFVFPTEEMRDAFYENFKKEIEICKGFL